MSEAAQTRRGTFLMSFSEALEQLGSCRGTLFLVVLAVNALALPYIGFTHDAELYAFQVQNRITGGAHADDLFFRYGSQDSYSLFSVVVSPVAQLIGIPGAFFLFYLASKALLLCAMLRFVETLVDNRIVSTAALIFMASDRMFFAGHEVFSINEPFLTPRLTACALVLLGLERMLHRRYWAALALMVVGFALHPIMAVGGLGILALWWGYRALPRRVFLCLIVPFGIIVLALFSWQPLGQRVFGTMDRQWVEQVALASPYNFPELWFAADWFRLVGIGVLVAIAATLYRQQSPREVHFLLIVSAVAFGGIIASWVAGVQGYKLLFQAQTYRAVWILTLCLVPIVFRMTFDLWARKDWLAFFVPCLGIALLDLPAITAGGGLLALCFLPIFVLFNRGLGRQPARSNWAARSVFFSMLFGILGWRFFKLGIVVAYHNVLLQHTDAANIVAIVLGCPAGVGWLILAVIFLALLYGQAKSQRRICLAAMLVFVGLQFGMFLIPLTSFYQTNYRFRQGQLAFVSDFMQDRRNELSRPPTVYWSTSKISHIWLELSANSYYAPIQMAGAIFEKQTVAEALRRAYLVRRFESARIRQATIGMTPREQRFFDGYYKTDRGDQPPTADDLRALVSDQTTDFLVLPEKFEGLYTATNGELFIYDCNHLRTVFSSSPPPAGSGEAVSLRASPTSTKRSSLQ